MDLAALVTDIRGCVIDGNPTIDVSGIAYDSRQVKRGDVFIAIEGYKQDGHDHVEQATKMGATAVVVQHFVEVPLGVCKIMVPDSRAALSRMASTFYGNPSRRLAITGVTGTNGKTTTCYLLRSIYQASGMSAGMLTTIEYWTGRKKVEAQLTTPESLDVQRILREMVDGGVKVMAMEVSSHALALKRVKDVEFTHGVFTNLTRDHLDFHCDMKDYLESKKILFEKLDAGGVAAINCDDPCWEEVASATKARVVKFGFTDKADFRATRMDADMKGTRVEVRWENETAEIESHLVGRHNAYNMMASAAVAAYSGIEKEAILSGIQKLKRMPGRLEPYDLPNGAYAFVDYAHTPDGLEKVLSSLKEVASGKIICVFGCGGDRDKGKRPMMGEAVTRLADFAIVTSDNPRSENPEMIIRDITEGIRKDNYKVEIDRRKAIEAALSMAGPGDCVLVAGKGHERFQIIGANKIPFDDREVISSLTGGKG
jgi:UDP-N-acetylmuramoyl-L-alanyl-D-glutamate--2,6-diaminopimelate ligase